MAVAVWLYMAVKRAAQEHHHTLLYSKPSTSQTPPCTYKRVHVIRQLQSDPFFPQVNDAPCSMHPYRSVAAVAGTMGQEKVKTSMPCNKQSWMLAILLHATTSDACPALSVLDTTQRCQVACWWGTGPVA